MRPPTSTPPNFVMRATTPVPQRALLQHRKRPLRWHRAHLAQWLGTQLVRRSDAAGPTSEDMHHVESVGDIGMSINAAHAAIGSRLDQVSGTPAASDATTQDETPTARMAIPSTSNTDTESLVGPGAATSLGSKAASAVQVAALPSVAAVNGTEANGSGEQRFRRPTVLRPTILRAMVSGTPVAPGQQIRPRP